MLRKFAKTFTVAALVAVAPLSQAGDVVVIGNKANGQSVDLAFVTKVYTGTTSAWPDGSALTPLDHADEGVRGGMAGMLGKTAASLKSTWATLMFAGKGTPPKVPGGDAEVKAAVAANKGAIGYIKTTAVDDSIKVLVK